MKKRSVKRYSDKAGQKLSLIAARDLAVGDRIMNTKVGKLSPAVKSVELLKNMQTVTFSDGRSATYLLKKDSTWIIDGSEAS